MRRLFSPHLWVLEVAASLRGYPRSYQSRVLIKNGNRDFEEYHELRFLMQLALRGRHFLNHTHLSHYTGQFQTRSIGIGIGLLIACTWWWSGWLRNMLSAPSLRTVLPDTRRYRVLAQHERTAITLFNVRLPGLPNLSSFHVGHWLKLINWQYFGRGSGMHDTTQQIQPKADSSVIRKDSVSRSTCSRTADEGPFYESICNK